MILLRELYRRSAIRSRVIIIHNVLEKFNNLTQYNSLFLGSKSMALTALNPWTGSTASGQSEVSGTKRTTRFFRLYIMKLTGAEEINIIKNQ